MRRLAKLAALGWVLAMAACEMAGVHPAYPQTPTPAPPPVPADAGTPPPLPPPCVPESCPAQSKDCGTISDGCGGTLSCGACSGAESCGGGGLPNVCGLAIRPSGTLQWLQVLSTAGDDGVTSVDADPSGNLFVAMESHGLRVGRFDRHGNSIWSQPDAAQLCSQLMEIDSAQRRGTQREQKQAGDRPARVPAQRRGHVASGGASSRTGRKVASAR